MTTAQDWRGQVGDVWAQEWRRIDRGFAGIAAVLDAAIRDAAPSGSFGALDIGSGAGGTSIALATRCPGSLVTGIDLSAGMAAVARARVMELPPGVARPRFVVGDAAVDAAGHGPFDLFVSRHGVMFFPDPVAAFRALRAAAAPGAPLVFSCFRDRSLNQWAGTAGEIVVGGALPPQTDAPGPFAFRERDRVAAILAKAGWRQAEAKAVDCSYRIGSGADPIADALGYLGRIGVTAGLLASLDQADAAAARERLADFVSHHLTDGGVDLAAAIWIWTAYA